MASWSGVELEFVTRWAGGDGRNEMSPVTKAMASVMHEAFTDATGQPDANIVPDPNALVAWAHVHPVTAAALEADPDVAVLWSESRPFHVPDDVFLIDMAVYALQTGDANKPLFYPPTPVSLDSQKTPEELAQFGLTPAALEEVEARIQKGVDAEFADGLVVHLDLVKTRDRVLAWEQEAKPGPALAPRVEDVVEKPRTAAITAQERAQMVNRLVQDFGLRGTDLASVVVAGRSRRETADRLKEHCRALPRAKR